MTDHAKLLVLAIIAAVVAAVAAYYRRAWDDPAVPTNWNEPDDGVQPWDERLLHLVDPKQRGLK